MRQAYDYRGYIITDMGNGYFIVRGNHFFSYDEACDWIDAQLDYDGQYIVPVVPELHLYHIFYVTKRYDRGYDEYIQAYSEDEAIAALKRMHRDIAYISDISMLD